MRLIDADTLKEKILAERDAIPKTYVERYGFGVEFPNQHGNSMRGGIRKALRCLEQTPTIDPESIRPKWISVEDRLPEIPEGWAECPSPVLYMMKSTKTIYAGYYGENGIYRDKYFRQYADVYEGVDATDVLCWMWQCDLPEPPNCGADIRGEDDATD